jgi:hypothetical protein
MAIIAKIHISYRDKEGELKVFSPGETVEGVNKAEEKRLLELGAAEKGQ